jgi:hypothetical protein
LIGLGFFAGLTKDPFLGMLGFLSFFVIGVTVIAEGFRRSRSKKGADHDTA